MRAANSLPGNTSAKTIDHLRWYICGLLFFATTGNYVDRQVISLLKPVLEQEFNWSEAKLSCYGRDGCAGIGVIARYEHDLPLPLQGRIRSKLWRRQMIEGLYQACSDKCFGHDFRREEIP